MATLASLAIDLTANSQQLVSELNKANGHLDGFAKSAETAGKVVKFAFAAATTGMFAGMIKESVDAADQMGKLSQRLGISTEAISELKHVAELSGVGFNTLTMGLQRMTRRLAEAGATGKGEAVPALQELGISAKAIAQLAPEQQFEVIAEALSKLSNEGDRVRLAMKFFDSEGVQLVQTMGNGATGIREMRAEANRLGLTLSQEGALAAAQFNDEITRAQATLNGFAKEIALNSVSAFNTLTEAFSNTGDEASNSKPELEGIQDVIKGAGAAAFVAFNAIQSLGEGVAALGFAVTQVLEGNFSGAVDTLGEGFERMKAQIDEAIEGVDKLYNFSGLFPEGGEGGEGGGGPTLTSPNAVVGIGGEEGGEDVQDPLARILGGNPEEILERLENQFATEEDVITNNYVTAQETLVKFLENKVGFEDKYEKLSLKNLQKFNKEKEKLKKQNNKAIWTEDEKLQRQTLSATAAFFGVMAKENKAFAVGQALINTYLGVSQSLAAYPMPVAAVMAATHLAAGLQNLNAIKSGGGGGSVSSSTSIGSISSVDGTESFIEQTTEISNEPEKTLNVNLNIDDEALLTKNQLRQIVDEINEADESNVRINV